MSDTQGVSPLTPASPNPHVQIKIAQVWAKGPVQLWSCCSKGMLNFWGKEAVQELSWAGAPSKGGDAHQYDPLDQSQLQDGALLMQQVTSGIGINSIRCPSYICTGTISRETQILFPGGKTFEHFNSHTHPLWVQMGAFQPHYHHLLSFLSFTFCCCIINSTIRHTVGRSCSHLSLFVRGKRLKKSSPSLHLVGCLAHVDDAFPQHLMLLSFRLLPDGPTACKL